MKTEIVTSDTLGDKNLISPLQAFGGKGVFRIGAGRCPFEAVRSTWPFTAPRICLPSLDAGLCIAAVSDRAYPGDVLVLQGHDTDLASFV